MVGPSGEAVPSEVLRHRARETWSEAGQRMGHCCWPSHVPEVPSGAGQVAYGEVLGSLSEEQATYVHWRATVLEGEETSVRCLQEKGDVAEEHRHDPWGCHSGHWLAVNARVVSLGVLDGAVLDEA